MTASDIGGYINMSGFVAGMVDSSSSQDASGQSTYIKILRSNFKIIA
jgi:hypothetical protein